MNCAIVVAAVMAGPTGVALALDTGACCLSTGTCVDGVTQEVCTLFEGVYQGDGSDCADIDCIGACCLPNGLCEDSAQSHCIAQNGVWQGNGTRCAFTICPEPTGACCLPDGSCIEIEEADCSAQNGLFQGGFTTCDDVECSGACCLPDGTVTEGSPQLCDDLGGSFQGFGTEGENTYCGVGACVLPVGLCDDLVVLDCDLAEGWHLGADSACESTITQVQGYDFPVSPGMQTVTFNAFDTQEQSRLLERVSFVTRGCIGAEITIINEGSVPLENPTIVFEGLLTYTFPCYPPITFSLDGLGRAPEGTVILPGEAYSFGEVAFCHDLLSSTDEPEVLACYVAPPPTIEATVGGAGVYQFVGSTEVTFIVNDFHAAGDTGLLYEFTAAGACCMCDGTCIESVDRESCEAMPGARAWIPGGSCADEVCACPADFDGSGTVDTTDLLALLASWGDDGPADLNCDDVVDTTDLLALLAAWGAC